MLIQTQGFGYASLEPLTPVTPHTLFYTGSTTKSFTAAGLSLLIDNSSDYSNIQWETPISHLLRNDFVLSDDWATAVSPGNVSCTGTGGLILIVSAHYNRRCVVSPYRLPSSRSRHRE